MLLDLCGHERELYQEFKKTHSFWQRVLGRASYDRFLAKHLAQVHGEDIGAYMK